MLVKHRQDDVFVVKMDDSTLRRAKAKEVNIRPSVLRNQLADS